MKPFSGILLRSHPGARLGLFLLAMVSTLSWAQGCVGCRTPGESMGDPQPTLQAGVAFSWSVLFLLVVVASIVGLLSLLITRACQQAEARHQLALERKPSPLPQNSSEHH